MCAVHDAPHPLFDHELRHHDQWHDSAMEFRCDTRSFQLPVAEQPVREPPQVRRIRLHRFTDEIGRLLRPREHVAHLTILHDATGGHLNERPTTTLASQQQLERSSIAEANSCRCAIGHLAPLLGGEIAKREPMKLLGPEPEHRRRLNRHIDNLSVAVKSKRGDGFVQGRATAARHLHWLVPVTCLKWLVFFEWQSEIKMKLASHSRTGNHVFGPLWEHLCMGP